MRKARSVVKYLTFGAFIILLDRLHQKFGRKRTSSSVSSETSVRSTAVTTPTPSLHVYWALLNVCS